MKNRIYFAALAPLFLAGCAQAQVANAPAATAPTDDRVAAIIERDAQTTKNGFPIAVPSKLSVKKTNFPVPAGAIWVAPDGRGNGTSRERAADAQSAIRGAQAGQTIVFAGGVYRVGELNVDKVPLTLQSAPNEEVWLCGSDVVANWTADGANWTASWDKFWGRGKNIDKMYVDDKFPAAAEREMIFINGEPQFQVLTLAEVGPGKFFADKANNKMVIGSDPTGKTVEVAAREKGVGLYQNGSRVRGLGFRGYADRGMHTGADNITIEDCTFFQNAESGFHTSGVSGVLARNLVIRGNLCVANGRKGAAVVMAQAPVIENNTFELNNIEGYRLNWDAAGLKVLQSPHVMLRENVARDNNASGLWLDIDCDDATYLRNTATGNRAVGIFFEISQRAIIAFNVATDNGAGIQVANSSGAQVYNNTLVNNDSAINIKWTNRKTLDPKDGDAVYDARDNVVKNNIFARTKPATNAMLMDLSHTGTRPTLDVASFDNNAYARTFASDAPLMLFGVPGQWNKPFSKISDLTDEVGAEKNGVQIEDKPIFVNAAKGDFWLQNQNDAKVAFELPAAVAAVAEVKQNIGYAGALPPAQK